MISEWTWWIPLANPWNTSRRCAAAVDALFHGLCPSASRNGFPVSMPPDFVGGLCQLRH